MNSLPADAYISYQFDQPKSISSMSFSADYGNGQGIRSFKLSTSNEAYGTWKDQGTEYSIPWTSAGDQEAGETVTVALNAPITSSKVKLKITAANTKWNNNVVMREIVLNCN